MELELSINGKIASLDVSPNESLLTLLRREGYFSVKQGCEKGVCGACTVLVDGVPRPSCVMLAAQAGGCTLTTVEYLGSAQSLHPLQRAFIESGAVQCGFCTPGMLLSAYSLLRTNPDPTEEEVRDALSGNLCRCNGYLKPVQAVLRAAALLRGETSPLPEQHLLTDNALDSKDGNGSTTRMPAFNPGSLTTQMPRITGSHARTVLKAVPAIDATKLALGKPVFSTDINLQNMLYGRVLTSPHAHAVIRSLDVSQAKALPGVHTVLTYKDVPRVPYAGVEYSPQQRALQDHYSLDYIMRYVGDRVAVIAAETPEVAEQALSLIDVEYDVLPPVFDPRKAFEEGAPRVHPEQESHYILDASHNVAARKLAERGDVEQGFKEAELIVEGEYSIPAVRLATLENYSVISYFDEDDYLVVRSGSYAPHHIRHVLASVLALPERRIKVVKSYAAGTGAGNQEVVLEDLCALLTQVTRRPVMLAYGRDELARSGHVRQRSIIRLKTGVRRDGTIVAQQMVQLASTGAYGTHPLIAQDDRSLGALALYPSPHQRYLAEIIYTNHPPSGALRGFGRPQEFFALESHMDEVAQRLGIDPLLLRRKNWLRDEYPIGRTKKSPVQDILPLYSNGLVRCLGLVEEKLRWREKRGRVTNGRLRTGVGISVVLHGEPFEIDAGTGGAFMKLNPDGTLDVFAGATEGGNGSTTLLAQLAAESLGLPLDAILLHNADTSVLPFDMGAQGSATLYANGGAVKRAAEQVRRQVMTVAGRMLNVVPEMLKISTGKIFAPDGKMVTLSQVAWYALAVEHRQIMTTASWHNQSAPLGFAAHGVEVEVDTETGVIRVLKVISAVDAGSVINPLLLDAQLQGNIAQALNVSLSEELLYDQHGQPTDSSTYHLLSSIDMPEIETYMIETVDPVGTKAVAEIPLSGVAPAVVNAVGNALRIPFRQLPLTPERILRTVHAQSATK